MTAVSTLPLSFTKTGLPATPPGVATGVPALFPALLAPVEGKPADTGDARQEDAAPGKDLPDDANDLPDALAWMMPPAPPVVVDPVVVTVAETAPGSLAATAAPQPLAVPLAAAAPVETGKPVDGDAERAQAPVAPEAALSTPVRPELVEGRPKPTNDRVPFDKLRPNGDVVLREPLTPPAPSKDTKAESAAANPPAQTTVSVRAEQPAPPSSAPRNPAPALAVSDRLDRLIAAVRAAPIVAATAPPPALPAAPPVVSAPPLTPVATQRPIDPVQVGTVPTSQVPAAPISIEVARPTAPATPVAKPLPQPAPIAQPQPTAIAPAAQVFAEAIHRAATDERGAAAPQPVAFVLPAGTDNALHAVAATSDSRHAALDLKQDNWPQAMIQRIEALRDTANANDTRIRLVPAALGTIDVALKRDGDTVTVHLAAHQPETRQILADAQPRLADLAESRGLKLSASTGSAAADAGGHAASQQQQQQRTAAATPMRPASPTSADDEAASDERIA